MFLTSQLSVLLISYAIPLLAYPQSVSQSLADQDGVTGLVEVIKAQAAKALPPFNARSNPFTPPPLGASRSPCPFLNSVANHGLLPRDGRNISIADLNSAQIVSLNLNSSTANTVTTIMLTNRGLITNTSADARLRIALADLNLNNVTEHDASLTRFDLKVGDNVNVNPGLVQKVLRDSPSSTINVVSLARSRIRVENVTKKDGSPPIRSSAVQLGINEAALLLLAVGKQSSNPSDRPAPKDWAEVWLTQERFPFELGWKRSDTVLNSFSQLASNIDAIRSGMMSDSFISKGHM